MRGMSDHYKPPIQRLTDEQAAAICDAILKAAGSGGLKHYMPYFKARMILDCQNTCADIGVGDVGAHVGGA